ncbi:serine/threonine-protein phosphatase 7 long form homolog isoform X1 [Arachis hypogaea]|uniref:serine/threonine-protein phosphatase 7 long form homolog isoform X1 n=1 Tax=Arachis hypogaea TaxID=3818 RepID=UPI003B212773
MRRQQGMVLDDRYVPYLQMAGLYHLARLNDRWFRLDEALVSAFVERWRPEPHTFHMPFGECTITLQDVAYQLGLPVDGRYVSGCLSEFHIYIEGGRSAWVWFEELLGVVPPPSQVQQYAVNCSWFQETFGECPEGADEDTVRRYARAYIMMLLGTQLFANKSGNRIHIRWLPFVARLEEMGTYSWGSAALAWLYRCMCRVANRNVIKIAGPLQLLQSWIFWRFPRFRPAGFETFSWPLASRYCTKLCLFQFTTHNYMFIHNVLDTLSTHISSCKTCAWCRWSGYIPSSSEKGPRVQMWRLWIDRLQDREFIWMPYSSPDVLQVVHPEVLEPRHMVLWRSVTSLIYFAVIEWHQIDRVLPQFGGVQPRSQAALNIDFLMSKDGRGGDRWFPSHLEKWHLYWDSRTESVLRFDVVADPGPSHEFLEWWSQHGKRFLSPDPQLGDPRAVAIPVEASQRGAGRVPEMNRPDDVPDRRRVDRRARVGRRRSQRDWGWLECAMEDDDEAGPAGGRRRRHPGRGRGRAAVHAAAPDLEDDDDDQHGPEGGDGAGVAAVVGVSTHDGVHGGEWYGSGMGDGAEPSDAGLGSGPFGHYFVGVPTDDQPQQDGTPWVIPGSQWQDFLGADTLDADFGSPWFLEEITAIMQEDEPGRRRPQTPGTQAPLDVDLNESATTPVGDQFGLGGTPHSAYTAASQSVAGPSAALVHFTPPAQPAPHEDADEIEDEEPFIRRGQRPRVPRRCGTGSHLFR